MSKCCMNCFPSCFGFPLLHILPDGWVSFREEFSSIAYHLLLMANGPTAPCHLQEPRKGGKWQMSQAGQSLEEGVERGTRRGRLGLCDVEGQPITAGRGDRKKGERERARKEGGREIKRGRADHMLTLRKNSLYASVLECVAAGGDLDRCGTRVAQLCTEEGRTRGGGEHCGAAEREEAKILGVQGRASWVTRY